jgi:hypothetical protein
MSDVNCLSLPVTRAVARAGRKGRSPGAQVKEGRKCNEEGRILPQISFAPPPMQKKNFFGKVGAQYFILARGAPTPRYGPGS